MHLDMPIEEAMRTQRAVRRYADREVPDDLILHLLDLAIRAPSGTNGQRWEFVVVKDPARKAALGEINRFPARVLEAAGRLLGREPGGLNSLRHQADHFADIPAVVVPCYRGLPPVWPFVLQATWYGSIYPAVQNLMLAARAAGLGSVLLTLPLWRTGRIKCILELPWNVTPCALVPLGWPAGKHGPNRRMPVEERVHWDRFKGTRMNGPSI